MEHKAVAYERNDNLLNNFTADGCVFVPIGIFLTQMTIGLNFLNRMQSPDAWN